MPDDPASPHQRPAGSLVPRVGMRPMLVFGAEDVRHEKTVGLCKFYLCARHADILPRVEAFIAHIDKQGTWDELTDLRDIKDEVLKPLDMEFEKWLAV